MVIRVALIQDIPTLASLAKRIWTEYYTPLLGETQVAYMLQHFQSAPPIRKAMTEEGMVYFLLTEGGKSVGYCGWKLEEDYLFLSKLYILREYRGMGFARQILQRLEACAADNGVDRIRLTVNKHNDASFTAYKKMGFDIIDSVVTDIGAGLVMDDFVMEKRCCRKADT